jgi:hypothetical protein
MKRIIIAFVVCLGLSAFIVTNKDKKLFKKLYVLEGVWKMNTKRGVLCEEWKKVHDNYLQSTGYTIKGIDTIINESVALTNTKAGIFYTSAVEDQNNRQAIAFKMTAAKNNTFVFENPQHDFPKRIVYELTGADSLHAYIDDGTDDLKKRRNFYYKRQ